MRLFYLFIGCTALLVACKKQIPEADKTNRVTKELYFREVETKIPIPNVKVRLTICNSVEYAGCSRGYSIDLVSDASGKCSYQIEDDSYTFVPYINIMHEKYWEITDNFFWYLTGISFPREGEILLSPIATLAISVKKNNTNAVDKLQIATGDSAFVLFDHYIISSPEYSISTDTTLYSKVVGSKLQFLRWKANFQDSVRSFTTHRFDTARVTITLN